MTQPFNLMPLFAVPLITRKIADTAAINAGLRRAVLAREAAGPGMTRSNADGWHSEQNLLVWPEPEIAQLKAWIDEGARHVARVAIGGRNKAIDIGYEAQGWANINRHGHYNMVHSHPGAHWSMVYYVDVGQPEPGHKHNGAFEFRDPRNRAAETPGFDFGRAVRVAPEAGLFMIFPAWVEHMVHPYYGQGERISLAINLRFSKFEFRDLSPLDGQAAVGPLRP